MDPSYPVAKCPRCAARVPCQVAKTSKNRGRPFYACRRCNWFRWQVNIKKSDLSLEAEEYFPFQHILKDLEELVA